MRKFVRHSKHSPVVEQVELFQATPIHPHIRYPSGRESTVPLRDLAPCIEPENAVDMQFNWYGDFQATDYDNANSSVLDNPSVSANENVTNPNESVVATDNLKQASETPASLEKVLPLLVLTSVMPVVSNCLDQDQGVLLGHQSDYRCNLALCIHLLRAEECRNNDFLLCGVALSAWVIPLR